VTGARTNGFDFMCSKLAVPVDWAKPDGPQTSIFVVRMHPRQQQASERIGSLVFNPGGPGVSGVTLGLSYVSVLPDEVLNHFDFVAFDPRGIGLSNPITCATDKQKDEWSSLNPDLRTTKGRSVQKSVSQTLASACSKKYGTSLEQYNTTTTARDLDRIREAVGDEKLSYLGFSYGTVLGAQYAHLFPGRLRAAVLDGAVDPTLNLEQFTASQVASFEAQMGLFASWCAQQPGCQTLGNAKTYTAALIKQADKSPLRSPGKTDTRVATGGIVTAAALQAMYDKASWPRLQSALLAARSHADPTGLFALADEATERDGDGHFTNVLEAFTAYTCNDSAQRLTDATIAQRATEWGRKYPVFGQSFAGQLYNCVSWAKPAHAIEKPVATDAPTVLVIGTTHDPATPYSGAASLVRVLGSAVELTWDGERHTAYPGTSCVSGKVDAYLISLTVPIDRACPAN
jgi:pimeloyl-ACP methyl ester carboxylesterase